MKILCKTGAHLSCFLVALYSMGAFHVNTQHALPKGFINLASPHLSTHLPQQIWFRNKLNG